MFERFTDRSRKSMQLANQEAAKLGHGEIQPLHVLAGLLKEGNGVAAAVLKNAGFTMPQLLEAVSRVMPPAHDGQSQGNIGKLPLSDATKGVLFASSLEANTLNHNYVGTEHMLLGLIGSADQATASVLASFGVTPEVVRQGVLDLLGFGKEAKEEKDDDARTVALNAFCVLGRKLVHSDTEKALYEASMGVLLGVLKPTINGGQ